MSGHSKWNNIKRKKGASDAARAKVFTKVAREISVAVKEGGPDPQSNGKLRDCIAKAKACNMPNDNIDRCIKKAAGSEESPAFMGISGLHAVISAFPGKRLSLNFSLAIGKLPSKQTD